MCSSRGCGASTHYVAKRSTRNLLQTPDLISMLYYNCGVGGSCGGKRVKAASQRVIVLICITSEPSFGVAKVVTLS